MSITVTNKTPGVTVKAGNNDSVKTLTTASLTPSASSLWVVFGQWSINNDVLHGPTAAPTLAVTGTNGLNVTWTQKDTVLYNPGGLAFWERISVFYGTPSSTSAGTLTLTLTDNSTGITDNIGAIDAYDLTATGTLGIGTSGTAAFATGSTSQSLTLGSAPASTSLLLGMHYSDNDSTPTIVAPSGWTEINDNADAWGSEWETAAINTGGSQTFTWTGLTAAWKHGSIAIEVTESGGGATYVAPRIIVPTSAVQRASSW